MWKAITLKYFKESIRDYPYATEVKKKKKRFTKQDHKI